MDLARYRKLKMSIDTDRTNYEGRRLKIRGRELCDLPPELFLLTELEILDLSPERQSCLGFSIGRLPASICKLENLKVLALDTNELTTLPVEMTKLPHLERLALSNNQLSRLPENFEKLQNLKSLHLANNSFHEFPISLTFIEGLEFLDLCDNNLKKLPDDIEKLTNIKLVILPDSICSLANLHTMWLGCNNLIRLPRNFGKLRCLDWGRNLHTVSSAIDGNPKLKRPPIDICKRGVDAIEQFFVQLDNIENKT